MRYLGHIIIAVAILIGLAMAASAYKYRFQSAQTIIVTGLAEKDFTSDQIVWNGSFSRQGFDLKDVYAQLKADETEIRRYLNANQIPDSNIVFSSVDVQRNYEQRFDDNGRQTGSVFSGYSLNGKVTVDSRNIAVVERLSREITGLLQKELS